jgi:hypothetical protein
MGRSDDGAVTVVRSRWPTVVLTALAGPIGSLVFGLILARIADTAAGGMAVLAAVVIGLWLGPPLLGLAVFTVCLFTIARSHQLRRGIALVVMTGAVIIQAVLALGVLRLIGDISAPGLAAAGFALFTLAALSIGAYVALTVSRPATKEIHSHE